MDVLILGAGFSGAAIARRLLPSATSVAGTTRSPERQQALSDMGLDALIYDGETLSAELLSVMGRATHLVQSIAPGKAGDPLMRPGTPSLSRLMPNLSWVAYLSTVGVYGDHKGAWVTEDTPLDPVSTRSLERVEAEEAWLGYGRSVGIPVAVLRLSGIYGPGRNGFCNLANGTARRLVKPGQVFNRIRVEDIAGAVAFLGENGMGGVFNVTDDEPAPPQDVVLEAARLMGVTPPPEMAFETADLSPMARTFYAENKRVSNAKLRASGYTFLHPDYRQSLQQMWNENCWKAQI
ncbi:NAD(P)-dependent oxidoreductase [Rhizobium sp. Leaf384]|uniref:SDR family oxidoreductase n=1 Tax=unclassified Rhizobium TaxID=2613769 RepID=UPI00071293AA|nr:MULTISPECIES: SDR family oxidoreductase [unclassified Rhizobium]KQS81617.1 NAD(P)-dependent oxidoreductase [Rhizobium sp. Leaf384]KQS87106.1 NAD(P)-dependent oxidoreductase [Rhizobium sp. Leaf383]